MPNKQQLSGLQGMLVEGLQDTLDAEKQLVRAMPKMARECENSELETAFREHLEQTKTQVQRLEKCFESMAMRAKNRPCKGMKGIVEEGQEHMSEEREPGIKDSVICEGARKVEHYEISAYMGMRSVAQQLGLREAAQLIEENLREEMEMEKRLAGLSKNLLKEAASGSMGMEEGGGRPQGRGRGASARASRSSSSRSSSLSKKRSAGRPSSSARSSRSGGGRGHSAHPITDHEEIRRWAEERGAQPACVRGTGGRGDIGMLRLDFPGYSGQESLEHISWDEWFEKFDERNLALMVQETTAQGQQSNFNKIVSRQSAQSKEHRPRARAAR